MGFDISVVICTRNRAASLRDTLTCLANADRTGLRIEVIVVNNGGEDETPDLALSFSSHFPVRVLNEPFLGVFGKSHSLNCALNAGGLGETIAVLDDDMSPHPDWFQGVAALVRRWPDKDLFTGRSYVIWPKAPPAAIAESGTLRTWMYSIVDEGASDTSMGNGRWFSGNHFWFRSRCLASGVRFDDLWLTEPKFMLDLIEHGFGAVAGPDAVAGHRIQEELMTMQAIRNRAVKVGRSNAEVRLRPYRRSVKHACFLNQHPLLGRLYCCGRLLESALQWLRARLHVEAMNRFVATMIACEQFTYHLHMLRIAAHMREYQLLRAPAHDR